ncbi:MAG: hypothetical protein JSW67_14280 [Candidatus Latescibacterota bacterium]|nr:MAG: hypothetical protein JSW67_14280 [Candidatus Latescibacterota bacterium]
MLRRRDAIPALLFAAFLASVDRAEAQIVIPNHMHDALSFEMHSVRDEVTVYVGDAPELLRLEARPLGVPPRVDFHAGRKATLRVRDLTLFDEIPEPDPVYLDGDEYFDDPNAPVPEAQRWEVRLSPSGPTRFLLYTEEGKGTFDLTDLPVEEMHIVGDSAEVRVDFSRPNLVDLRRCQITVTGGSLEFRDLLHAKPKSITVQCIRSECDIQVTGKRFTGEVELYVEGAAKKVEMTLSRKVGVRVEGPATLVARFDAKHMRRQGKSLTSEGYSENPCKVLVHVSESIRKLDVRWD